MKTSKAPKKNQDAKEAHPELPPKDILSEALKTVVGNEIKKRLSQLGLDLEIDFKSQPDLANALNLNDAVKPTPGNQTVAPVVDTPANLSSQSLPAFPLPSPSEAAVLDKLPTLGSLQGLPHPIVMRLQSDPFFRAGYLYQTVGNLTAAIICYSRSIQTSPSAEAHTYLGWVLCLMGEIDGAIVHARKAVELNAEYGTAWNDLGAYYLEKFSYDEAIECLTRALQSRSLESPSITYFNLGRALMSKGFFVRAQEALAASVKADPKFNPAVRLLDQIGRQLH